MDKEHGKMKLSQLVEDVACTLVQGSLDTEIQDIIYDSRKAAPGMLFFCIVGTQRDSHVYAADCAAKGVSALVIQHDIDLSAVPGVTVLRVENSRYAMARMSANLFGNPARQMTMIGVTGTKGKTTTTHMIKSVLEAAGRKVGMIGTNGVYFMGTHRDTANTTPESYELQKLFREFVDAGCDTALMEVSSQGIMMDRVAGIHYHIGVFTNLSPDHIGPGEHASFEEYRAWKGKLFQRCDVGIVNSDDANTDALLEGHTCRLVRYGCGGEADYRAGQYELLRTHDFLGVRFPVTEPDGTQMDVQVNMPGAFSVYNALAALCVGKALGLPDAAIHTGLATCVVKGRVELVPISKRFTILLDYAHNEVSTESLLETLRAYHPNRLVVVFGCGGNRSKLRRYGMGEVCAKMADFSILTEDNNRFEKIEDILADIRVGMEKGDPDAKYVEIPDRLDALHYAVDHAEPGDLIAVIGKGHEAYRDRMGEKTPFLERELLEEYAAQIGLE
jgi:UDP-N-acetylmuramoyl-L-alanyl-D-glutamate--2,6-diaminopimelate ligase